MHGAGSTGLERAWREEKLLIWDAGRWSLSLECGSVFLSSDSCAHLSSPVLWPLFRLFIDGDRIDAPIVKEHLLLDLGLEAEYRIQVLPYKSILSELKILCASLSPREKVWVSDKASYAVSEAIPKVGSPRADQNLPLWLPSPSQSWHQAASL